MSWQGRKLRKHSGAPLENNRLCLEASSSECEISGKVGASQIRLTALERSAKVLFFGLAIRRWRQQLENESHKIVAKVWGLKPEEVHDRFVAEKHAFKRRVVAWAAIAVPLCRKRRRWPFLATVARGGPQFCGRNDRRDWSGWLFTRILTVVL